MALIAYPRFRVRPALGLLERAMDDNTVRAVAHLRESREMVHRVRAERARLIEQIRQSQDTVERSQEILARLDTLLARLGVNKSQ